MWRARSLLWSWIANAIALAVIVIVFHGVTIGGFFALLEAALLFGLLNTLVKPLLKKLTLPLAVITLRLIWFVIAAVLLKLTAVIVSSFNIHGFFTLLWATIVVWLVNLVLDLAPGPWRGTRRDRRALSK
ncbi:MAG TPA: phage holin family protein [Gaiellaceae bacterium]|nr:phage holin family protein [Gaiellaceae bacterium]